MVWHKPGAEPVEFALESDSYVVGRDDSCDIVVDEPLVSRLHARLERRSARWFVVDLGSTNLTRVNGGVVSEWPLSPGDELRFARARCEFLATNGADGELPAGS
jgi:pSer/pThr/pTyr-binding forkhead associated (FHA) protein